jgi:hypothetical protein
MLTAASLHGKSRARPNPAFTCPEFTPINVRLLPGKGSQMPLSAVCIRCSRVLHLFEAFRETATDRQHVRVIAQINL